MILVSVSRSSQLQCLYSYVCLISTGTRIGKTRNFIVWRTIKVFDKKSSQIILLMWFFCKYLLQDASTSGHRWRSMCAFQGTQRYFYCFWSFFIFQINLISFLQNETSSDKGLNLLWMADQNGSNICYKMLKHCMAKFRLVFWNFVSICTNSPKKNFIWQKKFK